MADSDGTDGPTTNQSNNHRNSPPGPSSVALTLTSTERSNNKQKVLPRNTATDILNQEGTEDAPPTFSDNDTLMTEPEVASKVVERDLDQKEAAMRGKEDEEKPGEQVKCPTEAPNVSAPSGDDCDIIQAVEQKPEVCRESILQKDVSSAPGAGNEAIQSKCTSADDNLPALRDRDPTSNVIHGASRVSIPESPPQSSSVVADEEKPFQAKSDAQTMPALSTKRLGSPSRSSSHSRDDSKHAAREPRNRSVSDRFDLRATLNFTPRESSTSPKPKYSPSQERRTKNFDSATNVNDPMPTRKSDSPKQNSTNAQQGAGNEIPSEIDGPHRSQMEKVMRPESEGTSAPQRQPRIDAFEDSDERKRGAAELKDVSVRGEQSHQQEKGESVGDVPGLERSRPDRADTDRTRNLNEPHPNRSLADSALQLGAKESVKVQPPAREDGKNEDRKDEDRNQDQSLQGTRDTVAVSPELMDLDSSKPHDLPEKETNPPSTDGIVKENARETHSNIESSPKIQTTNSAKGQLSGVPKSIDMTNGLQRSARDQNAFHVKTEPEDPMDISPARSRDRLDKPMDVSPVSTKRDEPETNASRENSAASQAEDAKQGRIQSTTLPNESGPASSNHPPDSSKRKLDSSSTQRRKRERSPIVDRNKKKIDFPRESMVNRAFSGRVELSAYCGHRIVAHVGGQELRGWVLDADVSSLENRSEPDKQVKKEKSDEGEEEGNSIPPDIRLKPRKVPVARRTRKVVPLSKDRAMNIDDLGCAPGVISGSDVPKRSVIVIGAGIAGVAAARALSVRGFVVTVLEARGRLGGRIATDWSMGSPVDLGAAFIHGCYGNPLSEIAREADIRTYSPGDVGTLLYASGQRVSSSDDRHAESIWKALLRRSGTIARGSLMKHSSLDIALGKLIKRLREEVVDGCSEEVSQLLSWHAANLEAACASDMRNLSAKHYDMDDKSGFSGSHKLVRDGYASIVHALAGDLDVHYNSEVIAIQRDVPIHLSATEKNNVQRGKRSFGSKQYQEALLRDVHAESQKSRSVRYLDGVKRKERLNTGVAGEKECTNQRLGVRVMVENGKEYVAESCIVTVPLGVLQKGDISFIPSLPPWKHDVIHNIGFGLVNKVVLRFDIPFWVDDITNDVDEDRTDCDGPDHIGRVSSEESVFYMFLSLLRCVGAPILVAITSGRFAEHIERLSDEEVVGMALKALRHMFPTRTIGTLLSHSVTRWKTDRYARGSYSYAKVGTTPQDYSRMSEPVGTISFAGEATHRNHPATAHGAFMSGIREAARLIERSDLSEQERRKYARDLFLMQEPHATFEKAVTCNGGVDMGNGQMKSDSSRRHSMGNGNSQGIANGNSSRKKKRSQSSRG